MIKKKLASSILCLVLNSVVFGQASRPMATSNTAAPAKSAAPAATTATSSSAAGLYSWQIRPNDNDGYFSSDIPQPVCAMVGGIGKIFIFTNFDYYPSKNFNNYSNSVRVGEITTPADTYQLLSTNVTGDPHSLPGKRQEFAVTSVLKIGVNHTIYVFGGKNSSGELSDVYSYTPGPGFTPSPVATIPTVAGIPGNRSGAVAVPSKGMIYLFGGQQGSTVLNRVLEFDPQLNQFTNRVLPPMPQGFYGARAMTKAVGADNYIYLVGGKTVSGGGPNDRIYRFDVQTGVTIEIKDLNIPTQALKIPPGSGYPMITWDPNGNIRIITASGNGASGPWTWGNIQAWVLIDNYSTTGSSNPNDGKATLSAAPYNDAARARDMAGAVKCGPNTYLIGGTFGHRTTFQNRGMLVDRLGARVYGPSTAVDIKTKAQF